MRQTVSYCGVNAHHQNDIAEKKIRDSQESARKMVLFAKSKWPKAIRTNLWPYAQAHAINISNYLPTFLNGISPLEKFTRTTVHPKLKVWVPGIYLGITPPSWPIHSKMELQIPHRALFGYFAKTRQIYIARSSLGHGKG